MIIRILKQLNMQSVGIWIKVVVMVFIFGTLLQSCVKHKELITLNRSENSPKDLKSDKSMGITRHTTFKPYKIRPYDQLLVKVNAFDGNTEDYLGREFSRGNVYSRELDYSPESIYFNSYAVDKEGFISLPVIDKVKVVGLTIKDLKLKLDEAYTPYLKFASTSVKIANMRVTILGEVDQPGVQYLYNEKTTILDAISLAGGFTEFGNRNKVKVIRQSGKGRQTVYLNLSRNDFMVTEYYYVQPSDVIYIEPIKAKSWDVSSRPLGVVFSAISLGVLIASLFFRG